MSDCCQVGWCDSCAGDQLADLRQQLAEANAGAAVLRPRVEELLDLANGAGEVLGHRRGPRWDKTRDDCEAALESDAGRDILSRLTEAEFDARRFKEDYLSACKMAADMLAAIRGPGNGPSRGVVEDVVDVVSERDRLRAEVEQGKAPCTCGSGFHPRECKRHPWAHEAHVNELNLENARDELADVTEDLARARKVVEAARRLVEVLYDTAGTWDGTDDVLEDARRALAEHDQADGGAT